MVSRTTRLRWGWVISAETVQRLREHLQNVPMNPETIGFLDLVHQIRFVYIAIRMDEMRNADRVLRNTVTFPHRMSLPDSYFVMTTW